jgi:hypothetical protein
MLWDNLEELIRNNFDSSIHDELLSMMRINITLEIQKIKLANMVSMLNETTEPEKVREQLSNFS